MAASTADGLPIAGYSNNVRVKTVQVAIQDPAFADSIRDLLLEDSRRQVRLLEKPDMSSEGVVIADAAHLSSFPSSPSALKRLVVMAHKDRDDLSQLWDAGVRHVLFYEDSPETVRIAVLGMELSFAATEACKS